MTKMVEREGEWVMWTRKSRSEEGKVSNGDFGCDFLRKNCGVYNLYDEFIGTGCSEGNAVHLDVLVKDFNMSELTRLSTWDQQQQTHRSYLI